MLRRLIAVFFSLLIFVCSAGAALPEKELEPELRPWVEFWKMIFTRYDRTHVVFHHRDYPFIVYSTLNIGDLEMGGKAKADELKALLDSEYVRIQNKLLELADGKEPSNPAERRLLSLFAKVPGDRSDALRQAALLEKIRYQRGIKDKFRDALVRSGRYLPTMEQVFRDEGLPISLTRIPFIESSFDYTANSSVGAAGIWQFMKRTGKTYLRIDSLIDERRDPILATRAAARYLADAYERLRAWPPAITSYNHGVGGMKRAISEVGSNSMHKIIQNYAGSSFGFASKNFYVEFVAAVEIERASQTYFPGLVRDPAWSFDEIKLTRTLSLDELVRLSETSRDDVLRLNPSFLSPIVNGRSKIPVRARVMLPVGVGERVLKNLGAEQGERFRANTSEVAKAGAEKSKGKPKAPKVTSSGETKVRYYVVQKGDTLEKIAAQFLTTIKAIQEKNPKMKSKLIAGTKIQIPD
jgi:membrane-bound lytic murein transglycosylase D